MRYTLEQRLERIDREIKIAAELQGLAFDFLRPSRSLTPDERFRTPHWLLGELVDRLRDESNEVHRQMMLEDHTPAVIRVEQPKVYGLPDFMRKAQANAKAKAPDWDWAEFQASAS